MTERDWFAVPPFVGKVTPRDWSEDFWHENGCYQRSCVYCARLFYGYKRRVVCKLCEAIRTEGNPFRRLSLRVKARFQ